MFGLLKVLGLTKKCLRINVKDASFFAASAEKSSDNRHMIVRFNNSENAQKDEQLKYPLIWLRDNCQCPNCFHSQTKSRSIDWTKFNHKNSQFKSVSVDKELIQVTWQDDHVSKFDLKWLYQRNFTAENQKNYISNNYRAKPDLWSKDQFKMKEFEASDVFETDEGLYQWLQHLTSYGVAMIKNAPLTEDQCQKLASRVAFIRETHFGKEYAVRADPNAKNFSYTSNPLQFHTDLPFYEYTPGVTLLHCIAQTKSPGAFNLLTDGFHVAERLKKENPNAFKCLATTLVNWCDYGDESGFRFESLLRYPVICLDYEGNLNRINHSITQRDSFFSIDADKVDEWYESLRVFIDLLYEEAIYFKTQPGDILSFSNTRLLHGRTGYTDTEGNIRHLVGVFIDWDEVYSRLRVLANNKRDELSNQAEVSNQVELSNP